MIVLTDPSCLDSCDSGSTEVETPALAVVMPLILRGLKDRDERSAFGSCNLYIYMTTVWDGVSIFPSTKDYFQEIVFECFRNQTLWDDSWEMLSNIINMSCNTSITASPCHVKCLLLYLEYPFFQLPHCSYSPHAFVLSATPPIR